MEPLVAEKQGEIRELCRRYHVVRLELVGSAANRRFVPDRSDLDFLVEFAHLAPAQYASAFLEFKQNLEALFDRPVDLIVGSAIRNPYFRQSIEQGAA